MVSASGGCEFTDGVLLGLVPSIQKQQGLDPWLWFLGTRPRKA